MTYLPLREDDEIRDIERKNDDTRRDETRKIDKEEREISMKRIR